MKPIVKRLGRLVETMEPNYPYYIGDMLFSLVITKQDYSIIEELDWQDNETLFISPFYFSCFICNRRPEGSSPNRMHVRFLPYGAVLRIPSRKSRSVPRRDWHAE